MRATSSFDHSPETVGDWAIPILTAAESRHARSASRVRRRRPSMIQGQALEALGHAIEYLVDSRMRRDLGPSSSADGAAEQIMMRLSREVFAECAEVPPSGSLRSWLVRLLTAGRPVDRAAAA
jgi:hypothetical protein